MSINKERAWDALKRLSFNRVSASLDELKAAHLLKEECEKAGVDVVIESFEVPAPEIYEAKLEMTKPEVKEFYCTGQGRSGNTPAEGISGPLAYIPTGSDEELLDVEGKIVLCTVPMTVDLREKCIKAGAIGYIVTWGGLYDDDIMKTQVPHRNTQLVIGDESNFPGVMVHLATAEKLMMEKPEEVRIILKQDKDKKGESRNVVATIEGVNPKLKDEWLVFSAHYDSVEFSNGAWDNATGSITILELMHYFNTNKPERTIKFVWCGSEETGLRGSWAWCEMHQEDLAKIILNINFDMTGTLFGCASASGSCDESVIQMCASLAKSQGYTMRTRMGLMSTDSTSFALHDVPAMSFGYGAQGLKGAEIHSRRDTMEHLDQDNFVRLIDFVAGFASTLVNSKINLVKKGMPSCITKEDMHNNKRRHGWA